MCGWMSRIGLYRESGIVNLGIGKGKIMKWEGVALPGFKRQ